MAGRWQVNWSNCWCVTNSCSKSGSCARTSMPSRCVWVRCRPSSSSSRRWASASPAWRASNTNVNVRIGSEGNNGDVAQTNSAYAGATQRGDRSARRTGRHRRRPVHVGRVASVRGAIASAAGAEQPSGGWAHRLRVRLSHRPDHRARRAAHRAGLSVRCRHLRTSCCRWHGGRQ